MFDDRTNLTRQVAADLKEFFGDQVFRTVIPRSIRLAEAPSSASRFSATTRAPRARKATFNWPRRFWTMNRTENPRKALGKGLNALLSTRTQAQAPSAPAPVEPAEPADAQLVRSTRSTRIRCSRGASSKRRAWRNWRNRFRRTASCSRWWCAGSAIDINWSPASGGWRAAKLAGLERVPVVVRDIPDDRLLEITLIENIQREDLNPIETAVAFDRLGQELNLTAEQVGIRTGKDRSTVLNFMRLLQLPPDFQEMVGDRRLSQGHARSLLSLPTLELQREVARRAVAHGWSVRETERVTQRMIEGRQHEACRRSSSGSEREGGASRNWSGRSGRRCESSRSRDEAGGSRSNTIRRKTWIESTASSSAD